MNTMTIAAVEEFTANNLDKQRGYTRSDMQDAFLIGYFKAQQVVEWRKDNHAFILGDRSLARLVRWRDDGSSYQPDGKGWKYAVLSVGDMYVENTEYIPLANLHFIPEAL